MNNEIISKDDQIKVLKQILRDLIMESVDHHIEHQKLSYDLFELEMELCEKCAAKLSDVIIGQRKKEK